MSVLNSPFGFMERSCRRVFRIDKDITGNISGASNKIYRKTVSQQNEFKFKGDSFDLRYKGN